MNQAISGAPARRNWPARSVSAIARELGTQPLVYLLIAVLLAETAIVAQVTGRPLLPFVEEYVLRAGRAVWLLLCAAFVIAAANALARHKDRPLAYLRDLAVRLWAGGMVPRWLYASAVVSLFMGAFLYNKTLIPTVNPFSWDVAFSDLDRLLFGGTYPWQLLHPLLSFPIATILLDILYTAWVPLFLLSWCLVFASPSVPQTLRYRYWLATVACWIVIGLLLATAFSSAGPCYFDDLVPGIPSPYAGLEKYLEAVNQDHTLGSSIAKQYLWAIYDGGYDVPGGISAMPSMHNAQAVLFAAMGYSLNRRIGRLMAVYAVAIFVGSIHLAWHYAVDGIAGAILAFVVWQLAGLAVRLRTKAA